MTFFTYLVSASNSNFLILTQSCRVSDSCNIKNYLQSYQSVQKVTLLFFRIHIYTIICLKYVVVRTLQVAILARSPREMSLTDCLNCILPRYNLSRVRVSVRPRIFIYAEKNQICLKSTGVRSSAGCNSCSIASGDVSN